MRKANVALDEVMDDHLSFARKSTLREYAESIGVAVAVALLLRAFVVEAFQIPSGSMIPTLEVGDHIFVSKFSYGLSIPFTDIKILQYSQPKRGDVIVFKFPNDHSIDYIKRVVGLPGDTVETRNGQLYVNGNEIRRERERRPCRYNESATAGDDHDCEYWIETLGDKVHQTILEPVASRPGPPAHGDPAGRGVRDGRQPRQLLRLAQVGHGQHGPDQGARADHLVVARQLARPGTPAPGSRPSAGIASSPSSARRSAWALRSLGSTLGAEGDGELLGSSSKLGIPSAANDQSGRLASAEELPVPPPRLRFASAPLRLARNPK